MPDVEYGPGDEPSKDRFTPPLGKDVARSDAAQTGKAVDHDKFIVPQTSGELIGQDKWIVPQTSSDLIADGKWLVRQTPAELAAKGQAADQAGTPNDAPDAPEVPES
ncbi:MAG TPA: hypothetical protein VMR98_01295, partial [Candidatus Polarisedimenticolaceae bacterium]|nr:hypothetical protein [Candidatus Polarisedimenticolaceae bacterium]